MQQNTRFAQSTKHWCSGPPVHKKENRGMRERECVCVCVQKQQRRYLLRLGSANKIHFPPSVLQLPRPDTATSNPGATKDSRAPVTRPKAYSTDRQKDRQTDRRRRQTNRQDRPKKTYTPEERNKATSEAQCKPSRLSQAEKLGPFCCVGCLGLVALLCYVVLCCVVLCCVCVVFVVLSLLPCVVSYCVVL